MDIKSPDSNEIKAELVRSADVVTNNFRPGVSSRLGLDAKSLHDLNPGLVVMESPAYGAVGPKAGKAGFDPTVQAFTGHEVRAGGVKNAPLWNRGFAADFTAGQIGTIATLLGLFHRQRTGEGSYLVQPLVNAGIYLFTELFKDGNGQFRGLLPQNPDQTGFLPAESIYQVADGWIAIAVRGKEAEQTFKEILGLESTIRRGCVKWGEKERRLIAEKLKRFTSKQVLSLLGESGVWAEACCEDGKELAFCDEDLLELGTVSQTHYDDHGWVRAIGPLVRFSRSRRNAAKPAPDCGEHNREILEGLGFDEPSIKSFIERKIISH